MSSNISGLIDDNLVTLMKCLNEKNQDRSAKILNVLENIKDSTSNYYLKVLKNAKGVDWKEQEKWYFKASKDFLLSQDIDGDNVLHIFARENKTNDSTKFLHILNERLLSDRNFKNFTPFEEAIENVNPSNYKIIYQHFAVYGRLDTFQELVSQMTDVRYLMNLPHVFHAIAKASKSGDKNQEDRRIQKYNAMKKKICELDIMNMAINSLKLSSKSSREMSQLIRTIFQIFWKSGDLNFWQ